MPKKLKQTKSLIPSERILNGILFIRGKKGTKGGGKKALVYLKKGDKIELI